MGFLLGIDLGSGGCKVSLVDTVTGRVSTLSDEYPTYYPSPGWAEQDTEDWIASASKLIRRMLDEHDCTPARIEAIGISGVTHSLVMLDGSNKIDPIIRARVGADILCVGFPFSKEDVLGDNRKCEYYFVLQEHHDLPRFGLDVASKRINQSPGCDAQDIDINQLSWSDIKMDKAGYITKLDREPFANSNPDSVTSATIAMKTYQLPIRVAIHASELLTN